MDLKAGPNKQKAGIWWVKPADAKYVFIKHNASDNDENEYRTMLFVAAENEEDAKQQVLNKILKDEYRILFDRLWAWR